MEIWAALDWWAFLASSNEGPSARTASRSALLVEVGHIAHRSRIAGTATRDLLPANRSAGRTHVSTHARPILVTVYSTVPVDEVG
jgi:hypothetical protein